MTWTRSASAPTAIFRPRSFSQPRELDFITFNVFLHTRHALLNYLNHLQILADGKPLLLGEWHRQPPRRTGAPSGDSFLDPRGQRDRGIGRRGGFQLHRRLGARRRARRRLVHGPDDRRP